MDGSIFVIIILITVLVCNIKNIFEPQKWITLSQDAIKTDKGYIKEFYFKKANRHRFRVRLRIIILIILPIFNILGMFFYYNDYAEGFGNIFILVFSFCNSFLILMYILYYYSKRIKHLLSKTTYTEINFDDYKEIGEVCNRIIDKLGLHDLELKMYYVKTNHIEAHITLEGGKAHLFLSRGLISYSHNSLKEVESILGHEFGHIVQGDSKLFLITKKAFRFPIVLNNIQLVLNLVILLFTLMIAPRELATIISQLIIVFFYRKLYSSLNKLRKESEFLADLCSVVFVENSQMAKIIKNYLPDINSPDYPSKKERLQSILLVKKNIEH